MVKIDWQCLGRAFTLRVSATAGSKINLARSIGLTRPTFYRVTWGQPLDAETFLTVCDWLGESPNAFRVKETTHDL